MILLIVRDQVGKLIVWIRFSGSKDESSDSKKLFNL